MTTTIDIRDLPARFEEAIAVASAGGEVTLTVGAVARARLVAIEPAAAPQRVPGLHGGAMKASDDFDAPLPDDFWNGRE
jgi:antitoxin (DNA-binding transcriptional repressor) of toxin-antitoxin stability system